MDILEYIKKMQEMYGEDVITTNEFTKRNLFGGGGFVFRGIRALYKGKKGLQTGRIEKELMKKYRDEGMELIDAVTTANREAYEIVDNRKLKIVQDAMKKVDIRSDDYIRLMDEEFRLNDPESYTFIKKMVERGRDDLANKTRAARFPDWAESNFGENYDEVLLRNQAQALKAQSDEIDRMYPTDDPDVGPSFVGEQQMVDEIDEMNKANIAELLEGKKKHAVGGRVGYNDGQLVTPSVDGSRPGYAKQTKDFKTNFVNIKDIKKYDKKLLNKSIIVSEIVSEKIGANQAERVTLKNIFNVVNRTKDGDKLIENFKKNPNAENLLKLKARRKNRISFEKQQALPPIEKIELRKRKRIAENKWRNSGKGIKFYNSYLSQSGIFPARTVEERIWRDIYRASKQKKGESRFILKYPKSANVDKISGLPQTVTSKLTGNEYIPWDKFYKNITFYDTVSKKNIKFNTVRNWMSNNIKNGAKKYDNAVKNYKASNVINTFEIDGVALSKLAKDKQKDVFAKRITTAAAVNHRSGLNNFWDTEVTTASSNKMLNNKVQANITAYKNASNPNIEKKLLNIMKQNAKKIEGGGTIVLDDKITLGKKPTIKSVVSALEKELDVEIPLRPLLLKLSAEIDSDCKQAIASGGRVGLKTIGSPELCITKAKNYMSEQLEKGIGTQQNAKTSLIKRILAGSANFIKQNLSPKELLKIENLIGKPALYGAAAFETGLVADDVLRKGKPLNVAAAESLFGSILNLDANVARAKNLLESNVQLSPAAKEYAQNILDYDKYRKLDLSFPSSLIASKMPGSDRYFKMQEDLKNKIESTPDTGAMDYMSALDESEGAFKAKPKKLFGLEIDSPDAPEVTPLTNKLAKPARTRGPMTAKKEMKIDFSLPTYDRSPTYTNEELNNFLKKIGEKPLAPGEGTLFRMNEPDQRGLYGTQEKFATGGIVGDKSGPPPTGGPMSQGLRSLYNNGRKL